MIRKPADDPSDPAAAASGDGTPPGDGGRATSNRLPAALLVALATVLLQAVTFLLLGVAELVSLSTDRLAMGLSTAVFFLGYGALIGLCARGMANRQTWGRSIVVMGQLIQLGVAWSYRSGTPWLSAALAVTAVVVLVGIFHPASIAALDDED